jgi:hypothetical protein
MVQMVELVLAGSIFSGRPAVTDRNRRHLVICRKSTCVTKNIVFVTLVALLFVPSTAACFEGNPASQTLPNFSKVERWLYRGGRPDAGGVGVLALIGVKTIVSLEREWFEREPEFVRKEREWASQNGIRLIHIYAPSS